LQSGHCVGVEALLRWRDGAGELVPPDVFIPVAESAGIIGQLTERVLDLVCADAGHFLASHPGFHVAINLAPADLESNTIVTLPDRMMARCGAVPSNLIVEITERAFVNKEMARAVIAALHRNRRLSCGCAASAMHRAGCSAGPAVSSTPPACTAPRSRAGRRTCRNRRLEKQRDAGRLRGADALRMARRPAFNRERCRARSSG
jgi:hypothetical protein